jgi:hypothetical protein
MPFITCSVLWPDHINAHAAGFEQSPFHPSCEALYQPGQFPQPYPNDGGHQVSQIAAKISTNAVAIWRFDNQLPNVIDLVVYNGNRIIIREMTCFFPKSLNYSISRNLQPRVPIEVDYSLHLNRGAYRYIPITLSE